MRSRRAVIALAVLLSARARPVSAQVLSFDDIPDVPGGTIAVPELYHGYAFGGSQTDAGCGLPGQCGWTTNRGMWAASFPTSVSSP